MTVLDQLCIIIAGFVRVMENLESHEIFKIHFPGLESHGILILGHGKSWKMKITVLKHGSVYL